MGTREIARPEDTSHESLTRLALVACEKIALGREPYSYIIPQELSTTIHIGSRVVVSVKDRLYTGIVLDIQTLDEQISTGITYKDVHRVLDATPVCTPLQCKLALHLSNQYFSTITKSTRSIFPFRLWATKLPSPVAYETRKNTPLATTHEKHILEIRSVLTNNHALLLYDVHIDIRKSLYTHMMAAQRNDSKSSLLILPDLLSVLLWADELKKYFDHVHIVHGDVSEKEKKALFAQLNHDRSSIIVGTKLALFYPVHNIGLIIMEHEESTLYINEQSPRYDAREIAEYVRQQTECMLLVSSARPSLRALKLADPVYAEHKYLVYPDIFTGNEA